MTQEKKQKRQPKASKPIRLPTITDHRGDRWPVSRFGIVYRPEHAIDTQRPSRRGVEICLRAGFAIEVDSINASVGISRRWLRNRNRAISGGTVTS